MLAELYTKIRALTNDIAQLPGSFEVFKYTTTNIFTIAQTSITITKVLINNVETEDYTFTANNNKIAITASGLASGDSIEVDFTYYENSDSTLKEFIRAALTWMSIYGGEAQDMEIEDAGIYPSPDNATEDLIAIIASVLIKPNYNKKTISGITITYPKTMPKEKVIEQLVTRYHRGIGTTGLIEL